VPGNQDVHIGLNTAITMEVDAPTALAGFCLGLLQNSSRAVEVDDAEV
jgi:hypothetical protein